MPEMLKGCIRVLRVRIGKALKLLKMGREDFMIKEELHLREVRVLTKWKVEMTGKNGILPFYIFTEHF